MVEFLRTSKISSYIEDIIVNAKEQITFVTPYLKFNKTIFGRLVEKDDKGVKVVFVYGKSKLQDDQELLLRKLKNVSVFYLENLHAKCYMNEGAGIVTSMNLYDFSEKNNREMGMHFKKVDNQELYNDVEAEVQSIVKAARLERTSTSSYKTNSEEKQQMQAKIVADAQPSSQATYNQRILQNLKQHYHQCTFNYIKQPDLIRCENFTSSFKLEVEAKNSYYRISYQLNSKNYSFRRNQYKILYGNKAAIEQHFPQNVVSWGNQMLRVKFDFPQEYASLQKLDEEVYLSWIMKAKNILCNILDD
jgi:hypothetical protein